MSRPAILLAGHARRAERPVVTPGLLDRRHRRGPVELPDAPRPTSAPGIDLSGGQRRDFALSGRIHIPLRRSAPPSLHARSLCSVLLPWVVAREPSGSEARPVDDADGKHLLSELCGFPADGA